MMKGCVKFVRKSTPASPTHHTRNTNQRHRDQNATDRNLNEDLSPRSPRKITTVARRAFDSQSTWNRRHASTSRRPQSGPSAHYSIIYHHGNAQIPKPKPTADGAQQSPEFHWADRLRDPQCEHSDATPRDETPTQQADEVCNRSRKRIGHHNKTNERHDDIQTQIAQLDRSASIHGILSQPKSSGGVSAEST